MRGAGEIALEGGQGADDVAELLIRARFPIFAAVVAVLGALLVINKGVEYEQSLTSFFPEGDADVVAYQRASAAFGNDNVVFITYDDPRLLSAEGMGRVAELRSSIEKAGIDAVVDVQSIDRMPLFWEVDARLADLSRLPAVARNLAVRALEGGIVTLGQADSPLTIGGALRRAEAERIEELRARIVSHPLLRGTLVDGRGSSTALVVRLKPMGEQDPKATLAALRRVADEFTHRHNFARGAFAGPPVLLADGFTAIERDGQRLALVGLGLIGLVTLSVTRSLWWAIVPIVAGWTVWRAAETVMALLGLRLSLSGGPLVAQIIVLTMPAASHLAIHFRDALRREPDRRSAGLETIHAVAAPIFWTALTGAIGYGALLSSRVVPVFQFGAVLAACTMCAALVTLAISPIAMLPPFPLEAPVKLGSKSKLATGLNGVTLWVSRHPALVVASILILVAPLALGMRRIDFESNYINAFKPTARVAEDYRTTEARLGGIGVVSLVVPGGSEIDMETIRRHRTLGASIEALRRGEEPAVSQVLSLATVLDPEGVLEGLPPDRGEWALQAKLRLIASVPQGSLLRQFWSPRVEGDEASGWARLVIRASERQPAAEKALTFQEALELAQGDAALGDPGRPAYVTGLSYLLTQTTRGVIASSWQTFLWSAAGILVMLTLAYRSPGMALLAIMPALLAVGFVLGATAWMGLKLDLATALVASVALGLSVDDTFHCLLQYQKRRKTEPFLRSLLSSYRVTGPGVVLSSVAVAIGFAVLRLSEFVPFSNFGTMVGVATLGSSVGNLVLLPACLTLLEHRTTLKPEMATTINHESTDMAGVAARLVEDGEEL
jgi:predicted RND superfamily exporter protein